MGSGLILRRKLARGGENFPMSNFYRTGRILDKKANVDAKDFLHNKGIAR